MFVEVETDGGREARVAERRFIGDKFSGSVKEGIENNFGYTSVSSLLKIMIKTS